MDKNNISFTGIRNIGQAQFLRASDNTVCKSLSMVLSNDVKGKDLEDFNSVIAKITNNKPYYKNSISEDILNIECQEQDKIKKIYINGKYIEPNDKNLPIFSYIGKLTKKILAMHDNDMVVNKDYIDNVADDALVYGTKISAGLPDFLRPEQYMPQFFEQDAVKKTTSFVNKFLQKIMNNYFNI